MHKANIHKATDGLFLACFREVAQQYPELETDDILIDNACMRSVVRPERFDVMILPNLFGDIVSDLCAGLVGGLGVAPGAISATGTRCSRRFTAPRPILQAKGLRTPPQFCSPLCKCCITWACTTMRSV